MMFGGPDGIDQYFQQMELAIKADQEADKTRVVNKEPEIPIRHYQPGRIERILDFLAEEICGYSRTDWY